tara:strand:+ start:387 stop:632 length:246 start_codon:yes stop_codon:yes gene_type:complete
MSTEETEWKLLDKRLNHSKAPIQRTPKRATIKIDDDMENLIREVLNHERQSLTINTTIIDGILRTKERIEITLITTDGEID